MIRLSVIGLVFPSATRAKPPEIPLVIVGASHQYVSVGPLIVLLSDILSSPEPLHMLAGFGVALTLGVGLTVTTIVKVVPTHNVGPVGVII